MEEGQLEGAGEGFVVCMISGHGSWDVNACGWSALVKADGKGRSGVVYIGAQQMCGRGFDSAFEELLNKMLLNSLLKASTVQDVLNLL